jgi:hypothetical protein
MNITDMAVLPHHSTQGLFFLGRFLWKCTVLIEHARRDSSSLLAFRTADKIAATALRVSGGDIRWRASRNQSLPRGAGAFREFDVGKGRRMWSLSTH